MLNLKEADFVKMERDLCSRSLADFAERAWHVLEPATALEWNWAMDSICAHLEAVSRGEIKRLLINVPPGCMKSLLVGVIWPAWEWGPLGKPEHRYLGTAHKQDLAVRDSTKCRRLVQSDWYQSLWPVQLTGDQNAKTKFENESSGFREAMAFTGLTGARGSRILIDDPHSVYDAQSPALLASAIETFREAVPSRVSNSESAIVIIMQRLHENDVSAQALSLGYQHLCIPMRYEVGLSKHVVGPGDPRTEEGELMFPERFDEEAVEALEASLGDYGVAGQLQQRPAPRAGGDFKPANIEIVDALPTGLQYVRGWDLAGTTKKHSDYTATVKLAIKDGIVWIAHAHRFKGAPDEVQAAIKQFGKTDEKTVTSIPQDPGQAGVAQKQAISRLLHGTRFEFTPESGDKSTRAQPLAAQVNVGNVRMLRGEWNDPFLGEMRTFPMGAHDDLVDAASRAYNKAATVRRTTFG